MEEINFLKNSYTYMYLIVKYYTTDLAMLYMSPVEQWSHELMPCTGINHTIMIGWVSWSNDQSKD